MSSILMSIKPYYGFLIIAKEKGWDLAKYGLHEKTVEVRKGIPTSPYWDKQAALYFSKDIKSLARIPEEYRGEVAKMCGTVVGEFVCDKRIRLDFGACYTQDRAALFLKRESCLTIDEIWEYGKDAPLYGFHISDLKIYDKPKELSEFKSVKVIRGYHKQGETKIERLMHSDRIEVAKITRPPQSWCYIESLE